MPAYFYKKLNLDNFILYITIKKLDYYVKLIAVI
jgi:hypothetical protein